MSGSLKQGHVQVQNQEKVKTYGQHTVSNSDQKVSRGGLPLAGAMEQAKRAG